MDKLTFDVFISYRRDGGEVLGRLMFELLKNDYNVFFDHETLSSGRFDTKLLDIIEASRDVLVILSPGCFDRCGNEGDWFMSEISCALKHNKNIILLMTDKFVMPTKKELEALPSEIDTLIKYNGYAVNIAYIDSIISKLNNEMKAPKKEKECYINSISTWKSVSEHLAKPDFVSSLPNEIKSSILRNAITSFLDEYNAKIFTSILDKMSGSVYNIRTKFRYEIEIDDEFNFKSVDIDSSKYYSLYENFSYTKRFLKGAPEKSFWLSFATNLDDLDTALKDENFFFSENLIIDGEDMEILTQLDDEDKMRFYLSTMRTKINICGTALNPEQVIIDKSGIFARYELTEEMINNELFDVKIKFQIPQRMGDGYFFASINEPTYSPFIRFSYPEDTFDVTMIPFLNRSVTAKDTKIFEGQRELSLENEWVIPVSGAIFLIKRMD
ncbi:MAG: TIR domain-containing protein [Clostridia bacterium]|nr:TIR domain-containing protein [Clostridia bacterium]